MGRLRPKSPRLAKVKIRAFSYESLSTRKVQPLKVEPFWFPNSIVVLSTPLLTVADVNHTRTPSSPRNPFLHPCVSFHLFQCIELSFEFPICKKRMNLLAARDTTQNCRSAQLLRYPLAFLARYQMVSAGKLCFKFTELA